MIVRQIIPPSRLPSEPWRKLPHFVVILAACPGGFPAAGETPAAPPPGRRRDHLYTTKQNGMTFGQ
jgi:hypothetical protein